MNVSPKLLMHAQKVLQNPAIDLELHAVLESAMTKVPLADIVLRDGMPLWRRSLEKDARHDN